MYEAASDVRYEVYPKPRKNNTQHWALCVPCAPGEEQECNCAEGARAPCITSVTAGDDDDDDDDANSVETT